MKDCPNLHQIMQTRDASRVTRHEHKGMALVTVLLLTVLIAMMTVSMVFISTNHLYMMGNIEQKVRALKAAEAVAEYALTKLNIDPSWGINHQDRITIELDGARGSITFASAGEYLSYNNLKGKNPLDRASTGETRLSGFIPAYGAEVICKGETFDGKGVKYLKVIFVRNDLFPYPINSEGKIVFDAGDVNIYGSDINTPGHIHSNWDGLSYPNSDSDYWSIQRKNGSLNTKGGTASAVGDIDLPDSTDPNNVRIKPFVGPDGRLNFEDIDPAKIVDAHNGSSIKVDPGTYSFTNLYYIKDDPQIMKNVLQSAFTSDDIINNSDFNSVFTPKSDPVEAAAYYGIDTSGWDSVSGFTEATGSVTFNEVEGVTRDIRSTLSSPPSNPGWDEIRGKTATVSMNCTVTGTKNGLPVQAPGKVDIPVNIINGNVSFRVSPYNWEGYVPPEGIPPGQANAREFLEAQAGLGRINSAERLVSFLPPDTMSNDFGMDIKISGTDPHQMTANIKLTEDIYIGPSLPGVNDYKEGIDIFCNLSDVKDNAFRLQSYKFHYKDEKTNLCKEANLDIVLDLNDKNIYADSHIIIEGEVTGEGSMVTKGKLAYLHGLESNDIVSISGDDLTLQLSGRAPYYNINGYLYSRDDLQIVPWDIGPMYRPGSVETLNIPLNKEFTDTAGNTLEITSASPPFNFASISYSGGTYSFNNGVKLKYNGNDYDFSDYTIKISGNVMTLYDKDDNPISHPPYSQAVMNTIGTTVIENYNSAKGKPAVNVTGTVIGLNCHRTSDGDYQNPDMTGNQHGNDSIYIHGQKMSKVVFKYNTNGLGRITSLRGDSFKIRIASWFEL